MRLWHQNLMPHLPRQQLLGQHRECCALRGAGWGRKHSVVNYVFDHIPERLVAYHWHIMDEMESRGYHPDKIWDILGMTPEDADAMGFDLGAGFAKNVREAILAEWSEENYLANAMSQGIANAEAAGFDPDVYENFVNAMKNYTYFSEFKISRSFENLHKDLVFFF